MIVHSKYSAAAIPIDFENAMFAGVRNVVPGQRYYSPSLGRFINKDPIEEAGGLNLYGFCGNNGVNRWDYLGNISQDYYHNNNPINPDNWYMDGITFDDGHTTVAGDVHNWDAGGWTVGENGTYLATYSDGSHAVIDAPHLANATAIAKAEANRGLLAATSNYLNSYASNNSSTNAPGSADGNPTLTSSTSTRVGGALFQAHPTWGAVTQPSWPFNIASRLPGTNIVVIDGHLTVTVLTNPALNPLTITGTDGMIILDHENLHVGIYTSWWGQLVSSVSGVEGTYSSAGAADTAVTAANALARVTFYNAALQNNQLDWDHYGSQNPAEAARIISQMTNEWAARAAAQQDLNNLGQTWINQGYYKKGP